MNLIDSLTQPIPTQRSIAIGKGRFTQNIADITVRPDTIPNRATIINDFTADASEFRLTSADALFTSTIRPVTTVRATFPRELVDEVAERVITLLTERGRI